MSEEVATWYEEKSKEMGVSQSALMTIALKEYIDKERAMSMMDNLKQMIKEVKEIQPKK